jgi:hypothetical protein
MKLPVWTPLRVRACELQVCISGVEWGDASVRVKHPQSPARKDMAVIEIDQVFEMKEMKSL